MPSYRQSLNPASPKRQRGAIGLFGALVLGLALLFTALSVDGGRLMLEQRRLQKIADMAAIDASRALCGAVTVDIDDVIAEAQTSAERNGYDGNLASEEEDDAVQVGTTDSDGGLRRFESTTVLESATAVQVTARNTGVPKSLVAGGWRGGTTTLTAVATAANEPVAGFSAGSFLARVELPPDSGILNPLLNPLLNGLLGAGLDLDLVSYQGLADANVTLLELIRAHGSVGNVEELLTAQTTIGEIITLTASALSNNPDDADAALTLDNIADQVTNTTPITLGDLLDIDTTDPGAVLNAQLSALDLLTLGAQVANGTHAVTIPTAGVNIPGVLSSDLKLYVIEKPKIAIGPAGRDADGNWNTQVETAQVRLALKLNLLPVVGLTAVGPLNIAIDVAKTKAHLESIDCPTFRRPDGRATVGVQPGIAGLALGQLDGQGNVTGPANIASATLRVTLPLGLRIEIPVSVSASSASAVASPAPVSLEFDGPFPSDPQHVGTNLGPAVAGALGGLASNLDLRLHVPLGLSSVVNALLQPLLSALRTLVSNVVRPIITSLGNLLLAPVLSALGVTLGGADVQVLTLDGDQPALRI